MNSNIVYDIAELKQELDGYLDDLHQLRRSEKYHALLGDKFTECLAKWENSIRTQRDMPYTLVVCGEFKRGKSSFINALLGEDVVTTDVTTETITLNKISYGPHSNALVLEKGKRMLLTDEQLRRNQLEKILDELGEQVYQLELRRPIELLKQVTIVDTPGLSDSIKDFGPMVMEALTQADAVAYVFSVVYPLSQREQLYLRTNILPQKHTDLILVGNYADMLQNEKQVYRMTNEIQSRLERLLPGKDAYMISALDERCRQLGVQRPCEELTCYLENNFAILREEITSLIKAKCDMVLPDRMQRLLHGMKNEISDLLVAIEHGLNISEETLHQEQAQIEATSANTLAQQSSMMRDVQKRIKEMQDESIQWIQQMLLKMRGEVANLQSFDINDIRKYYPLYCIDTMQEALSVCFDYHADELYDYLDNIATELVRCMSSEFEQIGKASFRFVLQNKTWTKGDNVMLALNFTPLANSLGGFVIQGIAGGMRNKEMTDNAPEVYQDIRKQYDKLEKSVPTVVQGTYEQLSSKILAQMQEYFAERENQLKAQMEQTRNIVNRSTEEKEQIRQALVDIQNFIEGI